MNATKIVMVRPETFCSNPETQGTNSFQNKTPQETSVSIVLKAQKEFDTFQDVLIAHGIEILKFKEDSTQNTPDALFPNNWFCKLPDGRVFIFPMFAANRRREVRKDIIDALEASQVIDLLPYGEKGIFLEGTGSLIFDHDYKLAYACISPRTNPELLRIFSEKSGYEVIAFESVDQNGKQIYHTNVMMALGKKNVVINMSSISDIVEYKMLLDKFSQTGKNVVDISPEQTLNFDGNMLLLENNKGEKFWVCSTRAYQNLTPVQRMALESEGKILHSPLDTIETYGGGGARCLMGEVF